VNTYDPADYISYVTMDRQLTPGGGAGTPVGSGSRLPRGYANASPRTRLRHRAAERGALDDDSRAPVPTPPVTAVLDGGEAAAAASAGAPAVASRSDGTRSEGVRPVPGSLARLAGCGRGRAAGPAAVPGVRRARHRGPSAL
jgi:hypothetical protein